MSQLSNTAQKKTYHFILHAKNLNKGRQKVSLLYEKVIIDLIPNMIKYNSYFHMDQYFKSVIIITII